MRRLEDTGGKSAAGRRVGGTLGHRTGQAGLQDEEEQGPTGHVPAALCRPRGWDAIH